ncbi:YdbH domain-containing protein [Sodalis sp. RH21]|uniref:intermembrane phospholipid transport protein YdbH family protein n=1 Tax=unclassified Sodalis (in: enterobacteria) TaxID=2636512 RepID=UPI0039B3C690
MTSVSGTFWHGIRRVGVFLRKPGRIILVMPAALLITLAAGWYFLPFWLPVVAGLALPADVRVVLDGRPGWQNGAITLPGLSLNRPTCVWLTGQDLSARRRGGVWRLTTGQVTLDTACAASTPAQAGSAPLTWASLDRIVPQTELHIDRLTVAPWQGYAGSLDLAHLAGRTQLRYHNERLTLAAQLREQQLTIDEFTLRAEAAPLAAVAQALPESMAGIRPATSAASIRGALPSALPSTILATVARFIPGGAPGRPGASPATIPGSATDIPAGAMPGNIPYALPVAGPGKAGADNPAVGGGSGAWQITLRGAMTLSPQVAMPPQQGQIYAALILPGGIPLDATLSWRQTQGVLQVAEPHSGIMLARLPWRIAGADLLITDGDWRWPYATQPLSGHIAVTLNNWLAGEQALAITARMNMLTQGLRGKANAVLTVGPGPLRLVDNALDFHFTGTANQGDLALYASIPGQLRGLLTDPILAMLPGALLRVVGPVSPLLNINSARLPLAGVQLSARGLSGRLQAILQADATDYGRFTLHMDGRATDFLPDKGQWRWRYWGGGYLAPFSAQWDISGRGSWLAQTIELSELSSGLNRLSYGLVNVVTPRLSLLSPLRWVRDERQPALAGALRLDARRIDITRGGYLPWPALTLQLAGRDPQNFLWRGQIQARVRPGDPEASGAADNNPARAGQTIGPVRLNGRWDGTRLRGQAWWPKQPLAVFQTLLEPDLKITLRAGEFNAQSAFSAAAGQGFLAGGHATVSRGDIWMDENRLHGVALDLSYRLQDQRWLLGVKQPISLRIDSVATPVALNNLVVGLRGYYPYDQRRPLTLTGVDVDTLGGSIHLTPLSLPQRDAAVLKVDSIEMSQLITALKPKQFAISGRVSGELPLHFDDARGYIRHGWIANDSVMALRLDKQFADAIGSRNLATGAAIGWLRYMEITRLRADVDVGREGEMVMLAHIIGTNPQINAQREVRLNYRHEENIFQLWRSLRFGTNVEQVLEKQATVPVRPARGNQ